MARTAEQDGALQGWDWFDVGVVQRTAIDKDDLARSFARCFNGTDGALVLRNLRQTILDRRLGPNSSDGELRFLEGQRAVAAHIVSMIDRGRGRAEEQ